MTFDSYNRQKNAALLKAARKSSSARLQQHLQYHRQSQLPWSRIIGSMLCTFGKFTMAGKITLFGLLLIVFVAVFAPFITIYEPSAISGGSLEQPGPEHILGTDELGMDIWSQICYGARMSLIIGLAVALISGVGGGTLGLLGAIWEGLG